MYRLGRGAVITVNWSVPLAPVSFLQPVEGGRPGAMPGTIDYRLDRRRVLRALRDGRVDRSELCDAQAELIRVAKEFSTAAPTPCPVCELRELRHVRYVFGPRLPAGGRCINSAKELDRLASKAGQFRCYLIEVCVDCRWNHLLTTFLLRPTVDHSGRVRR